MICLPARVLPVIVISLMAGCVTSRSPVRMPPLTIFTTPGGMPASAISLPISSEVTGVNSCGFSTIVLPAAIAGATLRASRAAGKFHAVMPPITPCGSFSIRILSPGRLPGTISPSMRRAFSAAKRFS